MMDIAQGFLIVYLEVLYCKLFLEIFLEKRKLRYDWLSKVIIISMVICLFFISVLIKAVPLRIVSVIVLETLMMRKLYQGKCVTICFLIIIYSGILLCVDYLAVIKINNFFSKETVPILDSPVESTLMILLCKTIAFGIVLLIKKKWDTKDSLNTITDYEWLRFLYFPIMTIIAIIAMLVNFEDEFSVNASNTLLVIALGLVVMNLMVFYLIRDIVEREMQIQSDYIMKKRMKNQAGMYRSMSENFEQQRKRIHEYNNQINCIEGMLIKGNVNQTIDYISHITGGLKKEMDTIDTNNVIANAIINSKYKEAQDKNIVMAIIVNDLSICGIEEEDIVIILSNLLNNAIEACEKMDKKRIIRLKFVVEDNMTIISVKNTVKENIDLPDGTLQTTKENKEEHGIGIANIKEVVEKYKSSYVIQCQEGYFYFSIVITNKNCYY